MERRDAKRIYKQRKAREALSPDRFKPTKAAKAKRWRERHPEAICTIAARRRAKVRLATIGDQRDLNRFRRWARNAPSIACYWCGKRTRPGNRNVDHIVPLARGGNETLGNLCVACPSCNSKKSAHMPYEFCGQAEISFG